MIGVSEAEVERAEGAGGEGLDERPLSRVGDDEIFVLVAVP